MSDGGREATPMTYQQEIDRSKLDEMVVQWLEGNLDRETLMPLVIHCKPLTESRIARAIEELGGRIRHRLDELNAVSAWVSRDAAIALTTEPDVSGLEMVRHFTMLQ
jgi:hypothetical protein